MAADFACDRRVPLRGDVVGSVLSAASVGRFVVARYRDEVKARFSASPPGAT